jgi:hypothetical protein
MQDCGVRGLPQPDYAATSGYSPQPLQDTFGPKFAGAFSL